MITHYKTFEGYVTESIYQNREI